MGPGPWAHDFGLFRPIWIYFGLFGLISAYLETDSCLFQIIWTLISAYLYKKKRKKGPIDGNISMDGLVHRSFSAMASHFYSVALQSVVGLPLAQSMVLLPHPADGLVQYRKTLLSPLKSSCQNPFR